MINTHIFYDIKDLDLEQTFECGQCFRWNREEDGSYTGIALGYPANMKLEGDDRRRDGWMALPTQWT